MRSTPEIAAKSGRIFSIKRKFPKSFPYEVVFSLTRNNSLTPLWASHAPSCKISVGRREIKEPRKYGIAQNEQRRSQPDAIFSGAHGASPNLFRKSEPPAPTAEVKLSSRAAARATGAIGRSARRSRQSPERTRIRASAAPLPPRLPGFCTGCATSYAPAYIGIGALSAGLALALLARHAKDWGLPAPVAIIAVAVLVLLATDNCVAV